MRFTIRFDSEQGQKRIINFASAYFFVFGLNLLIKIALNGFSAWDYISKAVLGLLMIIMVLNFSKTGKTRLAVTEIIALAFFAVSYFIGEYSSSFFSIVFNVCFVFLPLAIGINQLEKISALIDRLYIISWPLQAILIYTLMSVGRSYSMSAGYALMFQSLIVIDHFFVKRKWYDIVAIVADVFFIIVFGSRGPLICIVCFVLLKILASNDSSKVKTALRVLFGVLVIAILLLYYDNILTGLLSITRYFGFSSRTLSMVLSGTITSDSGRKGLTTYFLGRISERPFFGWGVTGGWRDSQNYPHNLIIEIICSFGYILGIPIIVFLLYEMMRGLFIKDASKRRIIHIFFSYCISLMMSSSFLLSPYLFMCIAACMNRTNEKNMIST